MQTTKLRSIVKVVIRIHGYIENRCRVTALDAASRFQCHWDMPFLEAGPLGVTQYYINELDDTTKLLADQELQEQVEEGTFQCLDVSHLKKKAAKDIIDWERLYKVVLSARQKRLHCSCCKYQRTGSPCAHMLKVLGGVMPWCGVPRRFLYEYALSNENGYPSLADGMPTTETVMAEVLQRWSDLVETGDDAEPDLHMESESDG